MDTILDGLNEAQKSAVTSQASVLQVLAPPGSGKTKTLTARVAYLVSREGLKPWNIIVCTFTIKAAREMGERIRSMLGDKIESKLVLGTFHSVARRFLSNYGQEIGIKKNFAIADTSDSQAIIKRIVTRHNYSLEPRQARSRISSLKAKGISAEQFAATTKKADQHEFVCVYAAYEETLKASNLLDFDDLLIRCVDLLRKHPACVSSIQAVLIDEYQDTNNIQYELMTLLAQRLKRITIVGDPDQSIYSFRSAEIENLYRMQNEYPDSVVINLEKNYRSSGCILSTAMAVIEQDESRPDKPLLATHCVGEQPTLRHLATANVEAQWIVEEISRSKTLTAGLLNYNDYAILLRSAALSLSIEKALGKVGIPYRMVGGRRFFDRAEIKIILDYLRVINQPSNNDALARVINVPSRKIGEVTVKSLLEEAETKKISLWTLILDSAQGRVKPRSKISTQAQKGIDTFVNLILTSHRKLRPTEGEDCYLIELIHYVMQKISFEAYLKNQHKENWQERMDNVSELLAQAALMVSAATTDEGGINSLPVVEEIEQQPDTTADVLSNFLTNVALSTEVEKVEGEQLDQVTISTIHAAKGLEWPVVFIPAVYDGSIPHSRAEDHDEERRLLYVGMTRAQGLLYLSCPVSQSGSEETTLSKFVSSPSIERFFSARGPSFGCSTIQDLALILRRPCPSNADVGPARDSVEQVEDEKYPLTRSEINGDEASWGKLNSYHDRSDTSFKRRKLESTSSFRNVSESVTMQDTTGFSTATATLPNGNAGFTSANTHHKLLQEARAVGALISAPTGAAGKVAYKDAKRAELRVPRTKPAKPRAAGQGSITGFFSKPNSILSDTPGAWAPNIKTPSLVRSQTWTPQSIPHTYTANAQAYSQQPCLLEDRMPSSRRPLNHPMNTRPKRPSPEPDINETRYVLLSSSPVKPDNDLQPSYPNQQPDVNAGRHGSPTKPSSVASRSFSGFKPTSTFHSTSTALMQEKSGSGMQRKTLGMRRSMQGWSVKGHNPPRPQQ